MAYCSMSFGVFCGLIRIVGSSLGLALHLALLFNLNKLSNLDDNISRPTFLTGVKNILYASMTICAFEISTGFFVLIGVIRKKHKFMVSWMMSALFGLLFSIGICAALITKSLRTYDARQGGVCAFYSVIICAVTIINSSLILTIWMIYDDRRLEEEEENSKIGTSLA